MNDQGSPVLYAIVTGSPAARDVGELVDLAQADGWDVCVIASPDGRRFIDVDALVAQTGHPVRTQYKDPGTPDVLPPADAMIAAPITCNSLAKWAAGISDTLPLGLLVEAVGLALPVVAVPFSSRAHLSFPAIQNAMRSLSDWGVTVLGDDTHEPGSDEIPILPWDKAWQALHANPRLTIDK
ncbi:MULTISPECIES: flavoprotein [unclassified Nocardia]|uniref:flavoprotein n=1 Tax=unclassified Nocardia TaxID=2637762 RepID=UPI001CE3D5C6|nr:MULTISPECIES: flavoprotein [unclassified Nocardia]